jgi:hypothetical protein
LRPLANGRPASLIWQNISCGSFCLRNAIDHEKLNAARAALGGMPLSERRAAEDRRLLCAASMRAAMAAADILLDDIRALIEKLRLLCFLTK